MGSLSREEQKVAVLAKLARKRKIGRDYMPVENALGRIPSHARGEVHGVLDEMYKEGLIAYHKDKSCISIAPAAVPRVAGMVEDEVPAYIVERLRG